MSRRESAPWTRPNDIAKTLIKLWDSGRLPSSLISGENLFPLTIKICGPTSSEMAEKISAIGAWSAELEAHSNKNRRNSYRLEYRRVNHRVIGENDIPSKAVIESAEDAIALAGKTKEAEVLMKLTEETARRLPALVGYIYKKPIAVLKNASN